MLNLRSRCHGRWDYPISELVSHTGRKKLCIIGGDHTITYPVLQAIKEVYGAVAVLHFDAHLDTFGPYFGQDVTHGTPFRNAGRGLGFRG
jgi:arginase family enzyme